MGKEYTIGDFDMVKVDPATCHRCFFWDNPLSCSENPLVVELRQKIKGDTKAGCWFWGEESKFEKYTMPMANWKLKKERQLKLF